MMRYISGRAWLLALVAWPCVTAKSNGFLKAELSHSLSLHDDSPVSSALQVTPKESQQTEIAKEQEKLEELRRELKQQEELVAKERKEARAAQLKGMSVKEREVAAGKSAMEQLEQRNKAQLQSAKVRMNSYEKIMTRVLSVSSAKKTDALEKEIKEFRQIQEKSLQQEQEVKKRLMEKRIQCMQKVPGDQSGFGQEQASDNMDICKTEQEEAKLKRQYNEEKQVDACVQPMARAEHERSLREDSMEAFKDRKLTKKQKEYVEKQMKLSLQMEEHMAKQQQASQDRLIKEQFECMHKVCDKKAAKEKESGEERRKRTTRDYQECMSKPYMNEFSNGLGEIFKTMFRPSTVVSEQKKKLKHVETKVAKEEKKEKQNQQEGSNEAKGSSSAVAKAKVVSTETKIVSTKTSDGKVKK